MSKKFLYAGLGSEPDFQRAGSVGERRDAL